LWGELSDRAASAALRAQSVAEAIVPGRSVAVVASVAALAGGGVAIDEVVTPAPRTTRDAATVSSAADRVTTPATPLVRLPSRPRSATPATASTKPKRTARRRPRVRRRHTAAPVHKTVSRTAAAAAPVKGSGSAASAPARAGTAAPVTPSPAPAVAAPEPAAPKPAAPRKAQSSGEFGLEAH